MSTGVQVIVREFLGEHALPRPHIYSIFNAIVRGNGGAEGDRTPDLSHAMRTLSQLSYGPIVFWKERPETGTSLREGVAPTEATRPWQAV